MWWPFGLMMAFLFKTICQIGQYEFYRRMLWTAPELLRAKNGPRLNGTQAGDVYSFSIVTQEILFTAQPYFCDNVEPKRT